MTDQSAVVAQIRAKYPTPLGAQHPLFLIEVAKATGAKLLQKNSGTHVTLPDGTNVSQDILMFGDQGVDILSDGEGAATPSWQPKGTIVGSYIDVSGFGTPTPPAPPVVTPPATDDTPLFPLVVTLIAKIDALQAAVQEVLNSEYDGTLKIKYLGDAPFVIKRKA